jgi:hypothetical protein
MIPKCCYVHSDANVIIVPSAETKYPSQSMAKEKEQRLIFIAVHIVYRD